MATIQTLSSLYTNIRADMDAEFGVNISTVKKVFLRALCACQAAKLWVWYKVLAFVQKNVWPDTADPESKGGTLERFGRMRLGRNPDPAVAGQYQAEVTGSIGATIPAQSVFKSKDTSRSPGMLYILDAAYILLATTDTITLRALTPGIEGKLDIGDLVTSVKPLVLVNSDAEITVETVLPKAAEDIEAYRTATSESFRLETNGGAPADYRKWALDAQGVAKVYPYGKPGLLNENIIYVEATEADSTDGKGTPPALMLTEVEDVFNFNPDTTLPTYNRGRRPTGVILDVQPVAIINVDIEITGSTFTVSQKTLITNALTDAIKQIRPFVDAADVEENKNNIIDTNKIAGIIYAQVPGAVYSTVILTVNAVVVLTYEFEGGDIPYTNSVTFS